MNELLKREINKTYLILSSEGAEYEESYEIEMILKNELQMFLPLHVLRMDGQLQLFYEVSSKQTLQDCVYRTKLTFETICRLFERIEAMMKEVKDFLLNLECVVLDLEHIYTKEGDFCFCYCPWEKREVPVSFRRLLEEILENLDYHDTKGVELAYHLYQKACKGELVIGEILEEHQETEIPDTEKPYEYTSFEKEEDRIEETYTCFQSEKKKNSCGILGKILPFFMKKNKSEITKKEEDFQYERVKIEDEIIENITENHTILLCQAFSSHIWKLRPLLPGFDEFLVKGDSFLVGKKKECVDGYIDRDTISRIHSRLMVRDGSLYVSDANSTNGTFVNGQSLPPGKEVEIFSGDRILFADVEYECYNSL